MPETTNSDAILLDVTTEIVTAYARNNHVLAAELSGMIRSVHAALSSLGAPPAESTLGVEKPTPAQVRKSITPDALISFIDGKPYKTLKRHLTKHGLDPHSYRERYGLPSDYPMVCRDYAKQRSDLARAMRLGGPANQRKAPK